jgi:hypothetical protein
MGGDGLRGMVFTSLVTKLAGKMCIYRLSVAQGKLKLGMQVTHINETSVLDLDFENCLLLLKWAPKVRARNCTQACRVQAEAWQTVWPRLMTLLPALHVATAVSTYSW